jgi:hypothetical protein
MVIVEVQRQTFSPQEDYSELLTWRSGGWANEIGRNPVGMNSERVKLRTAEM